MMKRLVASVLLASVFTAGTARADEGMWTFDRFPSGLVKAAYGFAPSQAWLDHVRLSTARIAGGCSSSFVSPQGLVMTNHHCVLGCVGNLSDPQHDYVQTGFYAKAAEDEKACPGFEIDQLVAITDATKDVQAATAGKSGMALTAAIRAETAKLQATCGTDKAVRCDLVSLYRGGVYDLYRYHRYTDVRLVFAPEFGVAQFGGDPDNFNFPRYDFDIGMVRVYENGKPAATPDFLKWSKNGSKPNDLVFVAGNPGSTQRLLTVAQLTYQRDVAYPPSLRSLAEYRGILEQYGTEGAEQKRTTSETLFGVENSYKALNGQEAALLDPAFFGKKVAEERALRAAVAKKPALQARYGEAWAAVAAIQVRKQQLSLRNQYVAGPRSALFGYAQTLVRAAAERAKPSAQRLPEFNDANLVTLPYRLGAPVPVYPAVEEIDVRFALTKMREALGADDPFVRKVLGAASPAQRAHELVAGSTLGDPKVRTALLAGGKAAIDASTDPMIAFAKAIDPDTRAVRKQYDDEVANPERTQGERIAKARFAVYGTSVYPDATFSPRLSYGSVKGFTTLAGTAVPPYTTMQGLFDRATGAEPFVLPKSWLDAKAALPLQTPQNLVSTNDIIGGNSGSPLIDKNAEVVGLIFDGNIYSLGGAFGFDGTRNRSVSVDSRALLTALATVYHADRIVAEIAPK